MEDIIKDLFRINGREYEWADISILFGGIPISGFREIKYKKAAEKEAMYAKGRDAHSIQRGNNAVTGSLIFTQSQLYALDAVVAKGDLLDVQIDIVVSYGAELNSAGGAGKAAINTRVIKGVEFTEYEEGMSQGDKFMEISMPFLALDILKV